MSVSYVLNYIPKAELENLSLEYKVDYQVKKLDGQTMFQMLPFSMLNVKQNSLRVMEEFYHSYKYNYSYKNKKAQLYTILFALFNIDICLTLRAQIANLR